MIEVVRNGINFLVKSDTKNKSFWGISNWEYNNYQIISEKSKTHSTFINAGGWIGPFTLYAAKLFKNVYTLEPDIEAFNELKENVILNNFNNVKLYRKAFYDKNGELQIGSNYSDLGGSGTSVFQEKNSIIVKSTTLRDFFEIENVGYNPLLMLDVEGSEYVLFDDYKFFERFKPTILLSLHLTFLTDDNYSFLLNCLVRLLDIYDFDIDLIKRSRVEQSYNSTFKELNILMELKK
jgi:FkbM family methyltransferase